MNLEQAKRILEAAIMVAEEPQSAERLANLFEGDEDKLNAKEIKRILEELAKDYQGRGIELKETASGYRFQVQTDITPWLMRLTEERPPRYSRALLETLVLIAYRQPITRAEIEEIRSVTVNTQIIKTLQDRDWIKVVGHRDVPGKPALYATTKAFLDYFNLKSLEELPALMSLSDVEQATNKLQAELAIEQNASTELVSQEESEVSMPVNEQVPLATTDEINTAEIQHENLSSEELVADSLILSPSLLADESLVEEMEEELLEAEPVPA